MDDKAKYILGSINESGGEARFVGGSVRNFLIGAENTDVDIAANITPEEVTNVFEAKGIRVIPTGINFGTVTVVYEGTNYEITTLRKDIGTDGRHATVSYTKDWKEDSARRDFTFNALYMDLEGKIYDFWNGEQDLKDGVVRFIGYAEERIKEDYLRILRMFRFHSYYGKGKILQEQLDICSKLAFGLDIISGERIRAEMLKLLSAEDAYDAISEMVHTGILGRITEVEKEQFEAEQIKRVYDFDADVNPIVALSAILKETVSEEELEKLCERWRLSNKEKNFLFRLKESLLLDFEDDYEIRRSMRYNGKDEFYEYIVLNYAKGRFPKLRADELIKYARNFAVPDFPLSSKDLFAKGFEPGKKFGEIMRDAEEMWERSNYQMSKDDIIKKIIAG